MHEAAVSAIHAPFVVAMHNLSLTAPAIMNSLTLRSNQDIKLPTGQGFYIPDLAFRAKRNNMFQLEVAFTQSFEEIRLKIACRLQDNNLLGILVIDISEKKKFSSPKTRPTEEDSIAQDHWFAGVEREGSFGAIKFKDQVWLNRIEVDVYLFEQGWNTSFDDPRKVCRRLSFPRLCY